MKNTRKRSNSVAKLLFLLAAYGVGSLSFAQQYVLDPNWPKPLPDGIEWGQVPNVTIDRDGFIYAFQRAEPPVLKFDVEGNLVASFGSEWVATPHGFRAAPDGTLWATDFNRDSGNTVTQFDTNGRVLLRLGARGFTGTGPNTFDGPADSAVAVNGDIFVADGHWNNRIVKFSSQGRYLMEWGHKGTGPGELDMPIPL
jgi:hypothetical protein